MRTGIRIETPSIAEIERRLDAIKEPFVTVKQLMKDIYGVTRNTVFGWYKKPIENPMLKHIKLPGATTKGIRFTKFAILQFHAKHMMGNE